MGVTERVIGCCGREGGGGEVESWGEAGGGEEGEGSTV